MTHGDDYLDAFIDDLSDYEDDLPSERAGRSLRMLEEIDWTLGSTLPAASMAMTAEIDDFSDYENEDSGDVHEDNDVLEDMYGADWVDSVWATVRRKRHCGEMTDVTVSPASMKR